MLPARSDVAVPGLDQESRERYISHPCGVFSEKKHLRITEQGRPEIEGHELVQKWQMVILYDTTLHSYIHGQTSLVN